jgi:TetR/AcrR family transcriptional repressor of nem operon
MGRTSDARDRLLSAALDLIWTSSYGSVSVDDICQRAGVKKGSFYHFFPSKADLALAAYELHWETKRPMLDAIFSPQVAPLERLHQWSLQIYELQKSHFEKFGHVCGCPYVNVGTELATLDDRLRAKSEELLSRGLRYLESAIADAQRAGLLKVDDIHAAAMLLGSTAMGMILQAKVQNDPEVLRELHPVVLKLLGVSTHVESH